MFWVDVCPLALLAALAMVLAASHRGKFVTVKFSTRVWRLLDISIEMDGRGQAGSGADDPPTGSAAAGPVEAGDATGHSAAGSSDQPGETGTYQ